MEIWVLCWLVSALIGMFLGQPKGRGLEGAFAGLLLGPIGWIVAASLSNPAENIEAESPDAITRAEYERRLSAIEAPPEEQLKDKLAEIISQRAEREARTRRRQVDER